MPLVRVEATKSIDEEQKKTLLAALSKSICDITGKPEAYIMAGYIKADMMFAATYGDAAFVDIRSIGSLCPEINSHLSASICTIIESQLGISGERTYISFNDVKRTDWGWNSATF
jgi:phenylpyruvate tautomerase PptA (4-oxalocrotonate tautomerase family)